MARESLQYRLCKTALKNITTDKTITAYKRNIKRFAKWEKKNLYEGTLTDVERVQRYEKALEETGYSPATIHTLIAPVCKGFGLSMREIKHPKRTSDKITRGRNMQNNPQSHSEALNPRFKRSVQLSKGSGLRRAEIAKITPSSAVWDESGYFCIKIRGKGGKWQLQRILPAHLNEIKKIVDLDSILFLPPGVNEDDPILDKSEMGAHINYHRFRADLAKEAYSYYLNKLNTEQGYTSQLRAELTKRFNTLHGENQAAFKRYKKSMYGIYKLRGANAKRAKELGRPIEYSKLALLAVSVFHLSHWRLDVTVTNYII